MLGNATPHDGFPPVRTLVADGLTLFRALVVLVIIWLGATQGAASLPTVVLLVTAAWVADWLDGPLARSAGRPTLLGRYDFAVDVALTWASFLYLALAGFVPLAAVLLYTLLAMAAQLWCRRRVMLMLFMRGIDVLMVVTVLLYAPALLAPFAVLVAVSAFFRRKRLRRQLTLALAEMAAIARGCNNSPS
jgi:phosphatidylglycerophosphate synthase